MRETVGTVSLKIARLENKLKVLNMQKQLSSCYPDYQAKLTSTELATQFQLSQMIEFRDKVFYSC